MTTQEKVKDLLNHMQVVGCGCTRADLAESYGVTIVKEALLRGLVRPNGDDLVLTPRGERVAQGLPGEAAKQLTFPVEFRELIEAYLAARPDQPALEHFTVERGKVIITIKG